MAGLNLESESGYSRQRSINAFLTIRGLHASAKLLLELSAAADSGHCGGWHGLRHGDRLLVHWAPPQYTRPSWKPTNAASRCSATPAAASPSASTWSPCCSSSSTWRRSSSSLGGDLPQAAVARRGRFFGFWEMIVYLGFVAVGLFYIFKKGILDWSSDKADL